MKYLSLFSGIGGFELGIEQATKKYGLSAECIGFSEIDRFAVQIYQSHFPHHINYGDIKKITADALPDFDLLVGGFPCQSFSIAGKRAGFNDTRGTLFFEIARILDAKRPRLFLLENVKGLLSHDGGKTIRVIITALTELGYDIQWQVLNSKNHGVPQNRERIYIVGHLRGTPRPQVFPFRENAELSQETGSTDEAQSPTSYSHTIRGDRVKSDQVFIGTLRTHKSGQGFREKKDGLSPTIPARAREDGSGQPVIRSLQGARIRRLTPCECERLQGFPDDWTSGGIEGKNESAIFLEDKFFKNMVFTKISDTQRYKTLGNAVTVNVVRDVMERILKSEI